MSFNLWRTLARDKDGLFLGKNVSSLVLDNGNIHESLNFKLAPIPGRHQYIWEWKFEYFTIILWQ